MFHSNQSDITASSANDFNISFAGQSGTVLSTFARVTVSLGIPALVDCNGVSVATQIKKHFAGMQPAQSTY